MKSPLDNLPLGLICPSCRAALEWNGEALGCYACGRRVPVKDGIPSFCDSDAFYEQYISHHVPYHLNPAGLKGAILRLLPYWSWREWRFWRRYVPRGVWLLDLGCARGREIFAERAAGCVGVDTAFSALAECARHYRMAVQSGMNPIPFESGSFDCVVTSHVIGHIPAAEKDDLCSEIARVLKTGGRSVNVIETDSLHPLVRFAKQRPQLYYRYFVEPVIENPVRLAAAEVALGAVHYTLGQWRYPLDHAQFIAAVFEKG
ncbi:MAG: methyltransferase domain-containing protein [Acidobacteria bacterium]|nr:methyltransferase domain-containing protein [Acidobacteriota bacterium]